MQITLLSKSSASLCLMLVGAALGGCGSLTTADDFDLDSDYDDAAAGPGLWPGAVGDGSDTLTADASDEQWPARVTSGDDLVVVYQPQLDSWEGNRIRARCAVSITSAGALAPSYGVVSISARSEVDKGKRLVTLRELKVVGATFAESGRVKSRLRIVRDSVSRWPRVIPLDRLNAELAVIRTQGGSGRPSLDHAPPHIIYSSTPAVLILIDGAPVQRDAHEGGLRRVINTPALLLLDPASGKYYLDALSDWMEASRLEGPWSAAVAPPAALDVIKARLDVGVQPERRSEPLAPGLPPTVYVSTEPAELVQTTGPPQYERIPGTYLLYATNSSDDLFMDVDTRVVYVLLLGRWFTSDSLSGPWRWLPSERLPGDFARIDPDGPKGRVLVSVPGTEQNREALIANRIPQTATVERASATLEVRYDGTPQFKPIESTGMQYAINADVDVVRAEGRYYAVKDAVWFVSNSALGPWSVADTVPSEIYRIPASSPLYHDRFVFVYGSTPDVVYTGYTPGYMGAFADDGSVVYGTGYVYPPWCGELYYGGPWTWGLGYDYSYWDGGWFDPRLGRRSWYHGWSHMHRLYAEHWHPPRVADPANLDVYSRWQPSMVLASGAPPQPTAAPAPGAIGSVHRFAGHGAAPTLDLYAGRDDNVYLRRPDGWYQHRTGGKWRAVAAVSPHLAGEHASRMLGAARWSQFHAAGRASAMPLSYSSRFGAMHRGFGGGMGHAAGGGMAHGGLAGSHR